MSKKKTDIPYWAKLGHQKPVSRRDFLAAGLLPFVAEMFIPAWWNIFLMPSKAAAQTALNCAGAGGSQMIPFITVNLAGGAAMMSNYVPMDKGGQPLASYSKMGLGDGAVPLELEFGGATFAGNLNGALISKFLEGVRATAAASLANTSFLGVCVRSRDDSGENNFDVSGMVTKAGLAGSSLPNIGSANTRTGIEQLPSTVAPPSPLFVSSYNSIAGALAFTGSLATLSQPQKDKVAKLISRLNASQSAKLIEEPNGSKIKDLLECANIKNEAIVHAGTSNVDPRQNAQVAQVWGINANTGANNRDLIFAAMVYNGLLGQAGSVNLNMGGYDYHDNTRTTGNQRDRDAGVLVGRILETARILQKPLFLYVTSDGAVVSAESATDRQSPWTSDRGIAGGSYILMYNPSGRVQTTGFQIGNFTKDQVVDDTFVIGNSAQLAAQAVFANYLKFNNKMDLFDKVVLRNGLGTADLNSVIKVA
jgi:hypothetical protein